MSEPRPDLTRTVLAVSFIALLVVAPVWVVKPFLGAIVWATMLAVATWPLMRHLQRLLWGKRSLAVAVMTVGLLAVVVVPFAAAVIAVFKNVDELKGFLSNAPGYKIPPAPAWLGKVPLVGGKAVATWTHAAAAGVPALFTKAEPYMHSVSSWLASELSSFGAFLFQFLLMVAIQAVMLAGGEQAVGGGKAFALAVTYTLFKEWVKDGSMGQRVRARRRRPITPEAVTAAVRRAIPGPERGG
jgi:predicted PurR-regulated permease PerM